MKDFQSLKSTISGVVEGAEAVAEAKTSLSEREDTRRALSRVGGFHKLLTHLHKVFSSFQLFLVALVTYTWTPAAFVALIVLVAFVSRK